MAVDAHAATGSISNTNGVLEPGETVQVAPSWKNTLTDPQTFTGTASGITGPTGPTYTINDSSADYGTVNAGAIGDCNSATGDCYLMTVSGARPAIHWDATFTEDLSSNSISRTRTLHLGGSFTDVSTDIVEDPYYPHRDDPPQPGVGGLHTGTEFCPRIPRRARKWLSFSSRHRRGRAFHTPACAGIFTDVACTPGATCN